MTTEQTLRDAFRPTACGMPESIEQFQLALDAAYLAGQKVAEAQPPAPEQGDTHHWPQQGDQGWPPAPEAAKRTVGGEITKEWCMRMAMLEVETGADMEAGVQAPEAAKTEPVGINGLTDAETSATAAVMGLRVPETERAALVNSLLSLLDDQTLGLEEDQEDIIKEAAALLAADSKAGGEPVAWETRNRYCPDWVWCSKEHFDEFRLGRAAHGVEVRELYTRPQQQAKPLTDEQRIEIMVRLGITVFGPAAEAVEALIFEVERAHGIGDQA